ncbi:FxLYD domain-containing protein [Streptomyces coeruleoprunus]|uniref:FxLYD domain-containing protein n=1 Tax=Streptomyces coeruleoprunus TaxID=285563 RepID=A0ABV9XHX9_9ACTN
MPSKPPLGKPRRFARPWVMAAAVVVLAAGSGLAWWALGDGDPLGHVELSGGKLVRDSEDEDCDDTDDYTYNDCDEDTYEFLYKITNEGDEPANYTVIVNAFDEDGDYIGQAYVGARHIGPGDNEADSGEFDKYSEMGDHDIADIATVKVAHVERMPLAN